MAEKRRYGRCLTEEEYSKRLAGLFQGIDYAASGGVDQEQIAAKEFDLLIDFKLGIDFPKDKRVALGDARKRAREHHELLARRFQTGELSAEELALEIKQKIPAMMAVEFSKILPAEDVEKLLGIVDGQVPEIPVDPTKITRKPDPSGFDTNDE